MEVDDDVMEAVKDYWEAKEKLMEFEKSLERYNQACEERIKKG